MPPSPCHILNGDALLERFPLALEGQRIVVRECLVDGPVDASSLDELFSLRKGFLERAYRAGTDYGTKVVSELEKIRELPEATAIHLWFEDDLFCQVNLWFTAGLLIKWRPDCPVYLVRPPRHTPYGFGGLSRTELIAAHDDRMRVTNPAALAALWDAYRRDDRESLLLLARDVSKSYPFVLPAVEAHLNRFAADGGPGRPERALLRIARELGTTEFGPLFREFSRRESIYGFGDLQVRRILAEMDFGDR